MFKPRTYQDLCNAMQTGAQVEIDHTVGHINTISREDGSGRRWIVSIATGGETIRLYFNEPA